MKKFAKKTIALGCSIALMFGVAFPASANSGSKSHMEYVLEMDSTYEGFMANDDTLSFEEIASLPGAVVYTEYDALVNLKVAPVSELFAMGVDVENVEKIKSKSVKELVLENAALCSNEVLESKGLSNKTIELIKEGNYGSITEEEARAASAHLSLGIASISRVGNALNYNIYWHWDNSRPLNLRQDTITASITNGYKVMGGATAKLWLAELSSMTVVDEDRISASNLEGSNVIRFDVDMQNPAPVGDKWVQSGKAFVPTANGTSGLVTIYAEYFHKWLPVTVSVINGHISFPAGSGELIKTNTSVN